MATTLVGVGDPKAAKRWSGSLFLETTAQSYFGKKFIGEDDNSIIQRLTDLESAAGDTINYDLSLELRQKPVTGDNRLQGKEEQLKFYSDSLMIDQIRNSVSSGGKMSRKRTIQNLRKIARDRLATYWARYFDELIFIYLSGSRGVNVDYVEDITYAGHAGNPIQAPDSQHVLYAGTVTSKASLAATDKMTKNVIEKAEVKASTMRSQDISLTNMVPVKINGEDHYVCVMHKFQEHDMRTADTTGWLDIQKAAATAEGRNNPIFKGGLGMVKNVVLHAHQKVISFSDYGAGANVAAARALLMGAQAGVIAHGSTGDGFRFDWNEEEVDYGNEMTVAAGTIVGMKKSRFNGKDFGVLSIDTASKDPNS